MKICCKCRCEKQYHEFQKEKRKPDGITARCKICLNEDKRSYLDTKRDKIREYNRKKYYEDHEKQKTLRTERSKKFRQENNEKYLQLQRNYRLKDLEKYRELSRKYFKSEEYKRKRNLRKGHLKYNPFKIKARKILQAAVRVNFILRPNTCSKCGIECKPDGHHDDYSKPLEVRWLCKICHNHEHKKLLDIMPINLGKD